MQSDYYMIESRAVNLIKNREIIMNKNFTGKLKRYIKMIPCKTVSMTLITIVISVTGVLFSREQTRIFNYQTIIYETQTQPHFNISTYLPEKNVKTNFYENEDLMIYNSGGNFYAFEATIRTFLRVEHENKEYALPLNYFFAANHKFFGDDGNLIFRSEGYQNNLKLSQLSKTFRDNLRKNGQFGYIDDMIFIRIRYQDIFRNYHVQYFNCNTGAILDSDKGERIFKLHREYSQNLKDNDIDNIDVTQVNDYITSDKALLKSKLEFN